MKPFRKLQYRVLNRLLYSGRFGDIGLRKQLIGHLPKRVNNYIDIGAFDGNFFDGLRKEVKIAHALLLEPQPKYARMLEEKFSNVSHVKICKTILSDKEEEVMFHIHNLNATSSMLRMDDNMIGNEIDTTAEPAKKMKAERLDHVASEMKGKIDLLKIDVQGAELIVLKGGLETLKRTSHIWIEVSFLPLYEGSAVFNEVFSFMNDHGFSLISILEGFRRKNGELLQADCLFRKIEK